MSERVSAPIVESQPAIPASRRATRLPRFAATSLFLLSALAAACGGAPTEDEDESQSDEAAEFDSDVAATSETHAASNEQQPRSPTVEKKISRQDRLVERHDIGIRAGAL
jgi:hypothetical protein